MKGTNRMLLRLGTAPGRPDRPNEDYVLATADAVVLLDGAGTPPNMPNGCIHGTAWFVRTLATHLITGISPELPLADALADAISRVHYLHTNTCDLGHPSTPSATVLAARKVEDRLEYLVLSDSVMVFDRRGEAEPATLTDDRQPTVASQLRIVMDALPTGTPEHEEALRQFLELLAEYRNQPGGFWVAGADPSAAGQAFVGSLPVKELAAVTLLSDGASRLVDRFGLATWRQMLDILDGYGPAELIRLTRSAEDSDPEGSRWPRGKAHDDCTVAYWNLKPPTTP